MDTATGKLVGTKEESGYVDLSESETGSEEDTLFCPLILDHGVSIIISVSGPKILISNVLLDTSFRHCFQSVIIRSSFLLVNLQVKQFQYGLEFLRLSYS